VSNTSAIYELCYEVKSAESTKLLVESKIRIDKDFSPETRKVTRELIPYLKEEKKEGTGHS
jgi:hypothetical protein